MNRVKLLVFGMFFSISLGASINMMHTIEKNIAKIKGEKRYRRIHYKRKNGERKHKENRKNLVGYLSLLGVGIYAGEEALSSYKKFKKDNSIETLLESECGQQYIDLIAKHIEPYVAAAINKKGIKVTDILLKKRVFRALRNNVTFPHEALESTLLIPRGYPKSLVNTALNNDIVLSGEITFSHYVTSPLLQQLFMNQMVADLAKQYAKYFVEYMLSDDTTNVPDFVLAKFEPEIESLKKMRLDATYLSPAVMLPIVNNTVLKLVDKVGPLRTVCIGIPVFTIPSALFFTYRERKDLCQKSYNVLTELEQFSNKYPYIKEQCKKGLGYYQELITPEHLFLSKEERPFSVVCSYLKSESGHIGKSVGDKIVEVTEPVRFVWKNRSCSTKRGMNGLKSLMSSKENDVDDVD